MAKKTVFELAEDIADPSDFTGQHGLIQLDNALRCSICQELYDGPVSITCGHCFCSLCLRNSMNTKAECPICRKSANEGHIRPNVALEEAVIAWKASRDVVLQLMRASSAKKRKLEDDISDDEVQIVSGPSTPKRLKKSASCVHCPICNQVVKANAINKHIDEGCETSSDTPPAIPEKSKQKNEWSKVLGGPKKPKGKEKSGDDEEDRLPKVSFHIMKEKQLRELLARYELSTVGDKNTLVARYQHWSMLYNSNQDRSSKQRQTHDQLRTKLKKWEELGKGKKVVVEDSNEYQKTYKDEFDKLVQQARPKKPLSQAQTPKPESLRASLPNLPLTEEPIDIE